VKQDLELHRRGGFQAPAGSPEETGTEEYGGNGRTYPTGTKVNDEELAALHLLRDAFHGEWNYTILPRASPSSGQLI
jgi:hypothetical protein